MDGDAPEHHLPRGSAMRESDELPWNKGRKTRRSRPGLVQVHPPDGAAETEAAGGGSRDGGASGSFGSADDPALEGAGAPQLGASALWVSGIALEAGQPFKQWLLRCSSCRA